MKVYGLVGPRGTGKSFRAEDISEQIKAEVILDDGLLIQRRKVLAGFSAKFETNQIAAIKRAIFSDPHHRTEVERKIIELAPESLLVLGTSQRMIRTICRELNLPANIHWLSINDFASTDELQLASNLRKRGMHAIPIVESQLIESPLPKFIRRLRHRLLADKLEVSLPSRQIITVVSPRFNEGAIYIHPRVVRDSIVQLMHENQHPFTLRRLSYNPEAHHILHLHVEAAWNRNLHSDAETLISEIHSYLKDYLGFPHTYIVLHLDSIRLLPE